MEEVAGRPPIGRTRASGGPGLRTTGVVGRAQLSQRPGAATASKLRGTSLTQHRRTHYGKTVRRVIQSIKFYIYS